MAPEYYDPIINSPDKMTFFYIFAGLEIAAIFWIRNIINIDA
jgi:Flp pilus assembly protein TadB